MMYRLFFGAAMALALWATALLAQSSVEAPLPLDGRIEVTGHAVNLNWFDLPRMNAGSVTVKRRTLGQVGAPTWQTLGAGLGAIFQFTDTTTRLGVAYEYQVLRSGRDIIDVGYWTTGMYLPAKEARGNAYVIVDETIAAPLTAHLARLERDLAGDGWRVLRHTAPRGTPEGGSSDLQKAVALRAWLQERHAADPFGNHAVLLVGHLPVVKSGHANPDGHTVGPQATDLFYADMDGVWHDGPDGTLLDSRVPSDFIEMQVGRIDFSNVSGANPDRELQLLRAYLDKTHHWRMGLIGDLRGAYGIGELLKTELYGLRNIVGPDAVVTGGHHDVGEQNPWLWGVDFGDWNGTNYAENYANKAVFAINFGSGKQQFDWKFNAMTALLAQPWYPIAVGWGGRPAWWLHPMALGASIGDVHMRTVNNGAAAVPYRDTMDYFPTGKYLWRNPVWVNLLGDPTTRPFMLTPATDVRATETQDGVALSWSTRAGPDVLGYRVYRATQGSADFVRISGDDIVKGSDFIDPDPQGNALYMIRAYGLKRVYAGSFYTLSQGAFTVVGVTPVTAGDIRITTQMDQPVALPDAFNAPEDQTIHAIITGPNRGKLHHDGTGWQYTPPAGFRGEASIRFSLSDALGTDEGLLTIGIGE